MVDQRSLETQILLPGILLNGRYEIVSSIGTGGMGAVYLARDTENNQRNVALKVLHKTFAANKTYVSRFLREVELLERVDHPNVVRIFDFATDHDLIYYTMEYVPGKTLEQLLEQGAIDFVLLSRMIAGVCRGLHAIHQCEIVHRDLKPGNIIIGRNGDIKITDFGVARPRSSRLTGINQRIGSVAYMAPEIWRGEEPTAAVDYYSLGVMLYELITRRLPFDHPNPLRMMELHLDHIPDPPSRLNPNVPAWLDDLIVRLLAKNPELRINTAHEILTTLEEHGVTDDHDDLEIRKVLSEAAKDKVNRMAQQETAIFDVGSQKPSERAANPHKRTIEFYNGAPPLRYQARHSPTLILEMTATPGPHQTISGFESISRKKTVIINLPRQAAIVFEIEKPSRDFIYLGVFFASLQILDGVLTHMGVARYGTIMEGNPFLKMLMERFTPENALFIVKSIAVLMVAVITVLARQLPWIKNMIAFLSCIYLFAAIIPWIYLLFYK